MYFRDYMTKFRPLYAPDAPGSAGGSDGAAAAPASGTTADAPAVAPAASADAPAPAAAAPAADAPPLADGATAPQAGETEARAPSLLEAAQGKPDSKPKPDAKPEAAAAKPAEGEGVTDPKKDDPAPADAAKPDAKAAKPDGDKPPADAKDAKDKTADATDPATKEATAAAQPPVPIKYEAFKLPEGLTVDQERLGKFTEIAGPAQVPQDVAQNLLNLHVEEIQRVGAEAQKQARDAQVKSWNTYVDTITTELRNDKELGGNRLETSLSMAKAVVEEYLPANEAAEYLALLSHNGMGNHRLQVKLLQKIGHVLNIFEDGIVPANPQSPKSQKSPGNRGWYDKTPGAASA